MDDRYKQIKKENEDIVKYLGDSYQNIANIYMKKARGFGAKNIDTEVKIKSVLEEIRSFDEDHRVYSEAIPNENDFINEKMKNISKRSSSKEKVSSIIAGTILIVVLVVWIAVGQYLGRTVHLDEPKDVTAFVMSPTSVKVTWKDVQLAKQYEIYYVTPSNQEKATRTISATEYVFNDLTERGTYKFFVRCAADKNFGSSDYVIVDVTLE